MFCSFRTANLAYFASLSSIRRTAPLPLPQHDRGQALDPDTLYLLFETNEGDTPRILTSQMDSAWMSPARGSVPIAWAVDPLLGQLFPELLNLYVQTATQNDSFVAGLDVSCDAFSICVLSISLTQNVSLSQGAGYVYLSSLGSHAEAYERRAATLMAKFNTPVVDVGIPGLNLERPDLTTASTLSEMEAYRSAALRSGQPAPAAFLNACGSHYGQPLLTWLRDGTPVLNSLCTGPVSNSSTGPCHDSNGHCQDSHYLYYYRDHLNQSAPASDLAGRLTWARKTYRRPGQPMFLLVCERHGHCCLRSTMSMLNNVHVHADFSNQMCAQTAGSATTTTSSLSRRRLWACWTFRIKCCGVRSLRGLRATRGRCCQNEQETMCIFRPSCASFEALHRRKSRAV